MPRQLVLEPLDDGKSPALELEEMIVRLKEEKKELSILLKAADAYIEALENAPGPCSGLHGLEPCYECHCYSEGQRGIAAFRAVYDTLREARREADGS